MIRRTVVDDDCVVVGVGLTVDRIKTPVEEVGSIVGGNEGEDLGIRRGVW